MRCNFLNSPISKNGRPIYECIVGPGNYFPEYGTLSHYCQTNAFQKCPRYQNSSLSQPISKESFQNSMKDIEEIRLRNQNSSLNQPISKESFKNSIKDIEEIRLRNQNSSLNQSIFKESLPNFKKYLRDNK